MKTGVFILCTLFFLTSGILGCDQKETTKEVETSHGAVHAVHGTLPTTEIGEFLIGVSFNPNPPDRGRNKILVMIMLKKGLSAIKPAKIEMMAIMPAMGAMSEMQSKAKMTWQANNKASLGEMLIGMGGTWTLDIHFTPSANQPVHQARFKLTTGSPDLVFLNGLIGGREVNNTETNEAAISQDAARGAVVISPARQQWIGVKTEVIKTQHLTKTIRTLGRVTYNERKRSEISLKFSGFIGEIFADFIGKPVLKGAPLFTIYSPDLSAATSEYLSLLSRKKTKSDGHSARWEELIKTARQKLILWNILPSQIDKMVETHAMETSTSESPQYFPILSPLSGVVVEKQIVRGSPVMAGQVLYRLADLSTVWIESAVFESELPLIRLGLPVKVTPSGFPETALSGTVSFIAPVLNPESRSLAVRIEADNRQGKLLPEMSVTAEIEISIGEVLGVPKEAVIYTGNKTIVFVALSQGRFIPKRVKIGRKGETHYEMIEGLSEGEKVVTNGNFLIASESRLTSGFGGEPPLAD